MGIGTHAELLRQHVSDEWLDDSLQYFVAAEGHLRSTRAAEGYQTTLNASTDNPAEGQLGRRLERNTAISGHVIHTIDLLA